MLFVKRKKFEQIVESTLTPDYLILKAKNLAIKKLSLSIFSIDFDRIIKLCHSQSSQSNQNYKEKSRAIEDLNMKKTKDKFRIKNKVH